MLRFLPLQRTLELQPVGREPPASGTLGERLIELPPLDDVVAVLLRLLDHVLPDREVQLKLRPVARLGGRLRNRNVSRHELVPVPPHEGSGHEHRDDCDGVCRNSLRRSCRFGVPRVNSLLSVCVLSQECVSVCVGDRLSPLGLTNPFWRVAPLHPLWTLK